ncbi:MAG: esterase-like activity of phytase family protein, partial [Allosphingosinicella sp.]
MSWTVERLDWADEPLGEIALPGRTMRFRSGFGSGLSRRPGDPPGIVWAVGDRGPNIKVKAAVELYGLDRLEALRDEEGAKIMPRLDLGPAIAELRVLEDRVELVRSLRIADAQGRPVSGLPVPGGAHMRCEPAFDLDGEPLPPDPSGLDTEGLAALADGGFWVSDEFGPSLVRLDSNGRVVKRLVPEGTELDGAAYPVEACLPAIAARRQLNRGFEAIALSPDGQWLFVAFQSPLAHPDEEAYERARHVRLWRLDAATGELAAQYL